jgi:hypothetical protein
MDEFAMDRIKEALDEAKTIEDIKNVLNLLLKELPVEYVR